MFCPIVVSLLETLQFSPYCLLYQVQSLFGSPKVLAAFEMNKNLFQRAWLILITEFHIQPCLTEEQDLHQCYCSVVLISPTSVDLALSSLNWTMEEREIDVLGYIHTYIHTSFSQNCPWIKANHRQRGEAENIYLQSPLSLFSHVLSLSNAQRPCVLASALSSFSFPSFLHQVTWLPVIYALAWFQMHVSPLAWIFAVLSFCFNCKVKAVFFHSESGGGRLYTAASWSLGSSPSSEADWP